MGKLHRKSVLLFIITVAIIIPSISYAARPLSTDDAGVVEARHMEIESGFEYVKQTDKEKSLSLCVKYGIIEKLDLGIEIPYQFIDVSEGDKIDGISDIQIATKYHLLDETETLPALAMSCVVKTKTGDENKGLGSGELDYSLNGIITKEIRDFTTHVNLGYTFVGEPEGENLDDIFSYSLAIEYLLIESLNIVGEITGETTFNGDFDDNPFSGLVGLNYILTERLCFDAGIGFQISKASPDYRITTGLTLAF
ncbi:transporter [Candidatus Omnitrophota bacterium]